MIKLYDIVCILESKLDKYDVLMVPDGYDYVMKNRKMVKRKSRGIVIIYKKSLSEYITFLKSESEFVQWFEIHSKFTVLTEKVLMGSIYIPPENSKYASENAFDEIESELISLSSKNANYVSLFGDFNGRTGTMPDYVITDVDLLDNLGFLNELDDDTLKKMYSYQVLLHNKI